MTDSFERDDYYRILQVDPAAHPEVVRSAYRTLLRVLAKHPDLGGSHTEASTIIEAYRTLSDVRRRLAYDHWLRAHSRPASLRGPAAAAARPAPPSTARPAPPGAPSAASPRAPSRPRPAPPPADAVPSGVLNWIRDALPEFRLAPRVRFARSFDVVLERPSWLAPRLYVKAVPPISRADWATIFVLCRAVRVARDGFRPSTDTVLVVTRAVNEPEAFIDEAYRHAARVTWNRTAFGLLTLSPPCLRHPHGILTPGVLRRLTAALTSRRDGR
jgi:hypothetical protein